MNNKSYLAINVGSSSLKLAAFDVNSMDKIFVSKVLLIGSDNSSLIIANQSQDLGKIDFYKAFDVLIEKYFEKFGSENIQMIGHRVVFSGGLYKNHQLITPQLIDNLSQNIDFDPDHLPQSLDVIKASLDKFPTSKQIACFDSVFFGELPQEAKVLALPHVYQQTNLTKNGYHGLSYDFLMKNVDDYRNKKIIIAQLGSGSSLAAIDCGRAVDTTMSFSPNSGVLMSSRSGDIDPTVIFALHKKYNLSLDQINSQLNHQAGLMGISGVSSDMLTLLESYESNELCRLAVDKYCYEIKKTIGAYAASMGGLDVIVFSGGIGEKSAFIRSKICEKLEYLGIEVDQEKNNLNCKLFDRGGKIKLMVIPTDEELVIAEIIKNFN